MVTVIRWEDPPETIQGVRKRPRRTKHWAAVANELRDNPDRWAVVLEDERFGCAGGMAAQIKAGVLVAFRPARSFDAQTRTVGHTYCVYARYVGEVSR